MLRHVHGGAPVLTAERETLEQPEDHENYRRGNSDRLVARQKPNCRSRAAHDQQGGEERELSAGEIADASEDESSERPHREPDREGCQSLEKSSGGISAGKELRRNDRGETAEDVEVIPLDHRAD
jgi:hypothetical protein